MFGLFALAAASVAHLSTQPSPYMIDTSTLAYVDCGKYMGTAVHLGDGRYITAEHVIADGPCKIDGKAIKVESKSATGDWAIISSAAVLPFKVIYSCDRMEEGESYFASGFALGNPWPVTIRLVAEHYHMDDHTAGLRGVITEGMSGGSVVDGDGVLRGINDEYAKHGVPVAGVVELADTALCKKASA